MDKPYLVMRSADNCTICQDLKRRGFFGYMESILKRDFEVIFNEVDYKEIGDPDAAPLFNYVTKAPYFMVLLPETFRQAKTAGTELSEVIHRVKFFNGVIDPDGEFVVTKVYSTFDDLPKFCEEAAKELQS